MWEINWLGGQENFFRQRNCLCETPKAQESQPVEALPVGRVAAWEVDGPGCEGSRSGPKQHVVSRAITGSKETNHLKTNTLRKSL